MSKNMCIWRHKLCNAKTGVEKREKIKLLEMTCSFEKNIDMAHLRKATKFNDLKMDLAGQFN